MVRAAHYDDDYEDDAGSGSGRSLSEQIDLQHYLRILRKHKWPITLFTASVTILAAYYAFTATPVYRSTSTLLIEAQGTNPVSIESLVGVESEAQEYYETQFELLKSRQLAFRVIEHMSLWNDPELASGNVAVAGNGKGAGANTPDGAPASAETKGLGSFVDSMSERFGMSTPDGRASDVASTGGSAAGNGVEAAGVADPARGSDITDPGVVATLVDTGNPGDEMPELSIQDALDVQPEVTMEQQRVLANFMARLTIAPVRRTKLVKISYESTDPVMASHVANTVGEQYIESYLDARMELTTKAATWLNGRLQSLKGTLDESEDRLIAFKEANGLVDVDGSVGRLNEQELLLLTAELAEARSDLSDTADIYRETQALKDQPELLESLPAVQANILVQQVKIEQGRAQRSLDELLNRYGERHPRVVDAKSQLATLNTTLSGYIGRVVDSIANDYKLLQQRVATVQSKLASGKQEIQAIGTKKFELDALEREVGTNQSIYDTFFSRMTEARSADGLDNANARIADRAVSPVSPVKPKKQLIIALAGLASLVLSMLMAFLYEQMDDTIKATSDVEGKLGVKLLGILPLVKSGLFNRSSDSALPLDPTTVVDKKGTFAESVNTIRTALCLSDTEKQSNQVIMLTSSVPGEGKSTVSVNLGYSLAQLERVLIIDCDMRRPTMGRVAGLERGVVGLSDLIMGTATASECIRRGMFNGALDVLPSGRSTDQPLELLSSKRLEKIIEQLRTHYDRIVLDCAPTQAVSDALVLSKIADSVVFAIKSHDTSIELARRGLQRLDQVNAHLAGVVITQVDIDKIVSYGGDHYYQGYYDYYGYNTQGDKILKSDRLHLSQEDLISINGDDRDINLGLDYGPGRTRRNRKDASERSGSGQGSVENSTPKPKPNRRISDDLDII